MAKPQASPQSIVAILYELARTMGLSEREDFATIEQMPENIAKTKQESVGGTLEEKVGSLKVDIARLEAQGEALDDKIETQGETLRNEIRLQGKALEDKIEYQGKALRNEIRLQRKALEDKIETQGETLRNEIRLQGQALNDKIEYQGQALNDKIEYQGQALNDKIEYYGKVLVNQIEAQGKALDSTAREQKRNTWTLAGIVLAGFFTLLASVWGPYVIQFLSSATPSQAPAEIHGAPPQETAPSSTDESDDLPGEQESGQEQP